MNDLGISLYHPLIEWHYNEDSLQTLRIVLVKHRSPEQTNYTGAITYDENLYDSRTDEPMISETERYPREYLARAMNKKYGWDPSEVICAECMPGDTISTKRRSTFYHVWLKPNIKLGITCTSSCKEGSRRESAAELVFEAWTSYYSSDIPSDDTFEEATESQQAAAMWYKLRLSSGEWTTSSYLYIYKFTLASLNNWIIQRLRQYRGDEQVTRLFTPNNWFYTNRVQVYNQHITNKRIIGIISTSIPKEGSRSLNKNKNKTSLTPVRKPEMLRA